VLPWLLGVALNLARNRWRADRRARAALARLDLTAREVDFSDEVVERMADERRMAAVLSLFRRLPRREQEVLALCAWADRTYEDCAVVLGVPVGTIRSRLSRARVRLRELLAEDGPERMREDALGGCGF
jgi:RNA polymerase sigma-70 factor (ECF subfamily)